MYNRIFLNIFTGYCIGVWIGLFYCIVIKLAKINKKGVWVILFAPLLILTKNGRKTFMKGIK